MIARAIALTLALDAVPLEAQPPRVSDPGPGGATRVFAVDVLWGPAVIVAVHTRPEPLGPLLAS